ncbi:DUF6541 family protein [Microbacterium arabinogalactanolyticum]|uniref:DUF6541 family protein n=1 Tax=Microbacterium arabinogalactanolyticum TaxID=69365 RepID=UPI002556C784|nr:DUF6541 family protein [Microbacterium arabinogalactanolyticum]GLC84932.1 hypothetical protein MIAR_15200 [Microbacterium arabinogalactanolyticum]
MSADWLAQTPAFLATLALLILPGMPMALLLRLRGVLVFGAAIVGSLASIGAGSVVAPLLGMRWSLLPVLIVALTITVIAAVLWAMKREKALQLRGADDRWAWAGVGAAALGWALIVILGVSSASHPSQLFDGIFHLDAVEFILQHGDASPFHMTMVVPGDASALYPTLWHALVALVVPFSGAVVPATNVVTVVMVAVVWPVAIAVLTSVLFPSMRRAVVWAPLAAFGFSVFPLGFLNWGVLYPNLIGMLQVPLMLGFALLAARPRVPWPQRIGLVLLAVASAGATAMGHPSAMLGALVLLVPWAAWQGWRVARGHGARGRVLFTSAAVFVLVALIGVWRSLNVSTGEWLPNMTMAQGIGEVAFLSPVGRTAGLLIGPLAAIGIWRTARSKRWWILWSHAVAAGFYLAAVWLPILSIRTAIVGIWYDDATRVASLLGVLGLPLAGLGAAVVLEWLRNLRATGRRRRAAAVLTTAVLLGATHLVAVWNDISFMRNTSFRFDSASQGLTPDEAALFEKADRILESDSRVIGDPLTGASLLYAYTGHDVVFPHVSGRYGPDAMLLARSMNTGSAEVCEAVRRLGVTYAVDFGDKELFENYYTTFDGLHDLKDSKILTEVARVGDAALFEVTGCS